MVGGEGRMAMPWSSVSSALAWISTPGMCPRGERRREDVVEGLGRRPDEDDLPREGLGRDLPVDDAVERDTGTCAGRRGS